jgi:hypothetical protein
LLGQLVVKLGELCFVVRAEFRGVLFADGLIRAEGGSCGLGSVLPFRFFGPQLS